MAILDLELKHISSVESSIKQAVSKLTDRKNDYDGIKKDVSKIKSSTGNLTTCNTYLAKKSQQIQDKIDKLNKFKGAVKTFSTNSQEADGRCAELITDTSDAFYKAVGIKTGFIGWVNDKWRKVKKFVKTVWEAVKTFYEEHKFLIDFIVDVALLVVAVVAIIAAIPTGGATLFFAAFALAQALGDVFTSSLALGYHLIGDDASAGIWADRGLRDGVVLVGKTLFGEEGGVIFGFLYDGLTIASIIYSVGKLGKGLFKSIDFRNTNDMSFGKRVMNGVKELIGISITDPSKGKTLAGCWQIKTLFNLKSIDTAYKIRVSCDVIKNIKTVYTTVDSIISGDFFTKGNKIGSTYNKAKKTIIDMYRSGGFESVSKTVLIASGAH